MGLLLFYLITPLLAVIVFLLSRNTKVFRLTSFSAAGIQLLLTIIILFLYSGEGTAEKSGGLLFNGEIFWSWSLNISFSAGIDSVSIMMLGLVSLLTFSLLIAAGSIVKNVKEFYILFFLIITGANGLYISASVFSMLIFTGISAASLYFLIFQHKPEQRNILHTIQGLSVTAGFAILCTGITGLYMNSAPDGNQPTFNLGEISMYLIPLRAQLVFFPMVFLGFAIAGGLFPFNLFLPRILAEAPTPVSVIYTGIFLNMGTYGALKASVYLMPEAATELSGLFLLLAALTVIYYPASYIFIKGTGSIGSILPGSIAGMILFAMVLMNKTGITSSVVLMISLGIFATLFPALEKASGKGVGRKKQFVVYFLFLILVTALPLAAMLAVPDWFNAAEGGGIQTIMDRILSTGK